MNRPTLLTAVSALRTTDPRYPWIGPTPDEDDVAAVLELVEAEHQGDRDEPDSQGYWGRCGECGTPWPCSAWFEADQLALLFIGRAADRVVARARAVKTSVEVPSQRSREMGSKDQAAAVLRRPR